MEDPVRPQALGGRDRLIAHSESARSETLSLLIRAAALRGLTTSRLIAELKCTNKTFYDYLATESPHLKTVLKFCRALNLAPLYGRALLGRLTQRDYEHIATALRVDLGTTQAGAFFAEPATAIDLIKRGQKVLSSAERRLMYADYVLARAGVKVPAQSSLPPELAVINKHLSRKGFGFAQHAIPMSLDRQRNGLVLISAGLLELAMGASENSRINQIIKPRIAEFHKTVVISAICATESKAKQERALDRILDLGERTDAVLKFVRDLPEPSAK